MSEKEMRELDAWIAENVMGWKILPSGYFKTSHGGIHGIANWVPTQNSEQAMDVLKKCSDLSKEDTMCIDRWRDDERIDPDRKWQWRVEFLETKYCGMAETLELAICKFAKNLFSNQSAKR